MNNAEKQNTVSFKFTKTVDKKKSLITTDSNKSIENSKYEETKMDFINFFDRNGSKPKINDRVIPLPKKSITKPGEAMDSLTKEAMEELIKDASNIETSSEKDLRIPIISQARVETVEYNEEDYEHVPVEGFGKALLKGMGWSENMKSVPIYVPKRGFSCLDNTSKKNGKDDEEIDLRKGSYCVFISGSKRGRYGKVIDDDGLRMLVEMATSGETVDTCAACLRAVPKKEYEKSKKCINSSKVDEYLEEQAKKYKEEEKDEKHNKNKSRRNEGENDYDRRRDREEGRRGRDDSKGRDDRNERSKRKSSPSQDASIKVERHSPPKIRKLDSPKDSPKSHKASLSGHESDRGNFAAKPKTPNWLHPNLFVRIIDKKLDGGKYFKEKVIIEDVIMPFVCNCRTVGQTLIERVHQDQLETVVPKEVPSTVMIVKGRHKSQVATLLHKDGKDCRALVNLSDAEDSRSSLNLDFDDICQFIVTVS